MHCEECEQGPRQVQLQRKTESSFEFRHVCAECAGRILNTGRGWEVFHVEPTLVEELKGRIDRADGLLIRCLLIASATWPQTKAA